MQDKYEILKQIIKKNNIGGPTTNEYMWTLWYVNCIFYDKNIGAKDIKNHWTDENNDGGIDYVYYNDKNEEIYFIQGKSSNKMDIDGITNVFQKMSNTIEIFKQEKENSKGLNRKIIKAYKKGMSNRTHKNIKLVLITGTSINNKLKEQIDLWKNTVFKEYEVLIYGQEEIEKQEVIASNKEMTVKKGYLECSSNNKLDYYTGDKSGIIVNIKARSLKELYQIESESGLFGYNLREYISSNKIEVDNEIKNTIKKNSDKFWFYNNGITIACKKYVLKDNKLTLYDFSIINGAQTTTLIGKSTDIDNDNDFDIVCKVVSSPNSLDDDFIRQISIASNSQKEIESRDLFANSDEQNLLQYRFKTNQYPLAVTIKRGVKPFNYKEVESWQRIENTKLGQIILSSYLQKPGTARNTPKCIFNDGETYNKIFNKERVNSYNYNALFDFVRLQSKFEKYKNSEVSRRTFKKKFNVSLVKNYDKIIKQQNELGVLKNCGFTVISIISYLIKRQFFGVSKINSSKDDDWKKFVNKEFDTDLSLNYDLKTYEKNIEVLFEEIMKVLFDLFDKEYRDPKSLVNNPSNYFKSDEIYRKKIIPRFDELIEKEKDNIIFKKLEMFNDKKVN